MKLYGTQMMILEREFYDSVFVDPLNPPSIRTAMIEALEKVEYPLSEEINRTQKPILLGNLQSPR